MKKIVNLLLSLSLLGTLSFATPAFASDTMKVHLNGKEMKFNVDPTVTQTPSGGVTMVEFRPLFEAMGLQVIWTPDNPTQIIGKKDGLEIVLHIGSKITMVNGKEVDLLVAPQVVDNRTLVPLRFVSQASGKTVDHTNGSSLIDIKDSTDVTQTPSQETSDQTSSNPSTPNTTTNNVTTPPYAYKHLEVFLNGRSMLYSDTKLHSLFLDGSWHIDTGEFFPSLGINGVNFKVKRDSTGKTTETLKYQGKTIQLNDGDGVFIDGSKISDLKFVDSLFVPIDVLSKIFNYTYTADENGIYITSK